MTREHARKVQEVFAHLPTNATKRFGVIGDRLYCVVFTQRGDSMHIISMRKANKREAKSYVEQA